MRDYTKPVKYSLIGLMGMTLAYNSFYTIETGRKGLLLTFSSVTDVVDEGLHFKIPFVNRVIPVSTRTLKSEVNVSLGTSDLQTVEAVIGLNYRLDEKKLHIIFEKSGLNLEETIIKNRIAEIAKSVSAKYTAEGLLLERQSLKQNIVQNLSTALSQYHVILEDVQIVQLEFSKAFAKSIEDKQISVQRALTAKNDLVRVKVEGEQKLAMAKVEAETINIQAEAIKAQGGKEYVELKAIEKWNGELPNTVLIGNEKSMFSIPLK